MCSNYLQLSDEQVEELKEYLLSIGDSLVCVADEELVKVHVHTNHPGRVFEKGLEYGFLTNLKVDNLKLEHQEKVIKDAEKKAIDSSKTYGYYYEEDHASDVPHGKVSIW